MTAEELVIGHFDRTLTTEQQAELDGMVASNPEVRALFEQHRTIDRLMTGEAETIAPSSKLDKVALAAALGAAAEIAGKGVGISLMGKIAAVVSGLAVGGLALVLVNTSTPDSNPAPPAVRTPSATAPVAPDPVAPTPVPSMVDGPENATTLSGDEKDPAVGAPATVERSTARPRQSTDIGTAATSTSRGTATAPRALKIQKGNPVVIKDTGVSFRKRDGRR